MQAALDELAVGSIDGAVALTAGTPLSARIGSGVTWILALVGAGSAVLGARRRRGTGGHADAGSVPLRVSS